MSPLLFFSPFGGEECEKREKKKTKKKREKEEKKNEKERKRKKRKPCILIGIGKVQREPRQKPKNIYIKKNYVSLRTLLLLEKSKRHTHTKKRSSNKINKQINRQ